MGLRYKLQFLDLHTAILPEEGVEILDKQIKDFCENLPEGYSIKDWKITKNTERGKEAEIVNFDRIYLLLEKKTK